MDDKVYFAAAGSYDPAAVEAAVERLFGQLPAAAAVGPGKKVLLKPNLLAKHGPDKAVTTHPEVLRAVIRAVKRRGADDLLVADSPGGPYTPALVKSIYKASGLAAVCQEEQVPLYTACESAAAPAAGGAAAKEFTLLRPVLEADVLIDLPKLKTHMMTGLSAATKNLFGCIPGLQKAEWHMRLPEKERFGEMLVDLLETVKPAFAVLDAVVAHEGDGPSGGTPRPVGFVAAAGDLLQMDLALCAMVGLQPAQVPYLSAAMRRGLCAERFDPAKAAGEAELFAPIDGFKLPSSWGSVDFADNAPRPIRWAVPAVQRAIAPRPVIDRAGCIGCGQCATICPQKTVRLEEGRARILPKRCIRCFCCHEICPVGAIGTKRFFIFQKL